MTPHPALPDPEPPPDTRRDFIYYTTGGMAVVATGAAIWPLANSMNPRADVAAMSSIRVDLEGVTLGTRITVEWQGRPLFIDHRTEAQIAGAREDDAVAMPDPEPDSARAEQPEWLIVVGICTHLGCVPLGQGQADPRGQWDGWFCPCHGSHYDTSGRVRAGPAPRNLDVPPYRFESETMVQIG